MNNYIQDTINFRRELHENPELSMMEENTSRRVKEKLTEYGIPFKEGYAKHGILGIIKGEKPGGIVGIRADMDALPINESSGEPFSSKVENIMHACGHDAHTSMLVTVGRILNERRSEISGVILLIFQPAEENSPTGGSQAMMDDGIFDEYEPDVLLAQHVWPGLPVGQFGVMSGPIMGNSDRFKIKITGTGGHAAMPNETNDAIIMMNALISNLQTIVSRNVDPFDPAVLTIGTVKAGTAYNVIAEEAELNGTIRTQSDDVKELIKRRFHEVVEETIAAFKGKVEIDYYDGYPATVNDEEIAIQVKSVISKKYGEESVPSLRPSLGGEDFGRFLKKYPGVYYWLGTSIGEGQKPLHNPGFKLNEDALKYGVETMVEVTLKTLERVNEKLND
ncbi:M20 metallopeptidase family protein [Phocicoccus pinnipedialis]|uniref:Putative hydrolase YxeP n=1 Tax=Phocicoccus pinnipedialis TaxID=110845 RepID=A0A6V7REL7_9BACL|nr:M20 family metallopeptidase [Jeotgalicoccus pinnipedialis]MBP1939220.1 amidohydrolase [Jeotgalicoccus pinnipedialis]CAD2076254.1 putative hydrolase YxeP [Jeotgalicoccus pinnipedialis]